MNFFEREPNIPEQIFYLNVNNHTIQIFLFCSIILFPRCATGEAWPDIMLDGTAGRLCDHLALDYNQTTGTWYTHIWHYITIKPQVPSRIERIMKTAKNYLESEIFTKKNPDLLKIINFSLCLFLNY